MVQLTSPIDNNPAEAMNMQRRQATEFIDGPDAIDGETESDMTELLCSSMNRARQIARRLAKPKTSRRNAPREGRRSRQPNAQKNLHGKILTRKYRLGGLHLRPDLRWSGDLRAQRAGQQREGVIDRLGRIRRRWSSRDS
jgi:hypothetical protein